jgi:hypothetical protein
MLVCVQNGIFVIHLQPLCLFPKKNNVITLKFEFFMLFIFFWSFCDELRYQFLVYFVVFE